MNNFIYKVENGRPNVVGMSSGSPCWSLIKYAQDNNDNVKAQDFRLENENKRWCYDNGKEKYYVRSES